MSTTELSVINQAELDELISATGASVEDLTGGGDFLPNFKVNYDDEIVFNDEKKEIKPGTLFVTNQDVPVFAKVARIRPLMQHFQYIDYNDDEKRVENRSIFITNFKEEARDEKGTLRAGKPPSKVLKENKELAKQYENVNVFRNIHVLVDYEGTDPDGNKVEVKNVLAVYRGKGSNFAPFQEEYIDKMPKGSRIWDYSLKVSTTKEKNGASTYYVVHFEPDFNEKLPLDVETFELLKDIKARIDKINAEIDKKYYEAVHNRSTDDDVINSLKTVSKSANLDEDFDSDIPF